MRIERARPEHAATLTGIAFAAKRSWGYSEAWLARWAEVLTVTPEYLSLHPAFCAVGDGAIVGFCALTVDGAQAVLEHMWVEPGAAGTGVGGALFRHAEAFAAASGASILRVESDPHAEGFYRAMGAHAVGRRAAPMDGVERFLPILVKPLAGLPGPADDRP